PGRGAGGDRAPDARALETGLDATPRHSVSIVVLLETRVHTASSCLLTGAAPILRTGSTAYDSSLCQIRFRCSVAANKQEQAGSQPPQKIVQGGRGMTERAFPTTRRGFLPLAAAGTAAAMAKPYPAAADQKTITILHESSFIKPFDEYVSKTLAPAY